MLCANGFSYVPKGLAGEGEVKGLPVWAEGVAKGFTDSTVVGTIVTGGVMATWAEFDLEGARAIWKNMKDPPNPATIISRKNVTIMKGNFLRGVSEATAIVDEGTEFMGGVGGRDEIEAVWKGEVMGLVISCSLLVGGSD